MQRERKDRSMEQKELMGSLKVSKAVAKMAIPSVISSLVTVVYNTVTHRWKEYFKEGWYGMNCPECLNAMWNLKITKIFRVALVVILQGIIDFVSLSVQMIKGWR